MEAQPARPVPRRDGGLEPTPLFLPVHSEAGGLITLAELRDDFRVRGLITNAFLLYKRRVERERALAAGLHDYLGFHGLIMTDSGAFQGLRGRVYLANRRIVAFQEAAGADVVSPLDEITPPGDARATAERKLRTTQARLVEARPLVERGVLALVQQGGRFLDLRLRALMEIAALEPRYVALGSLVPFLSRGHDIAFVGRVIRQARSVLPPDVPVHLYGAGDPLELPFYLALGCDVFDSSSFGHYALAGCYMTPFGALAGRAALAAAGFACACPACADPEALWAEPRRLARHNLAVILEVIADCAARRAAGTLEARLEEVLAVHREWFPESRLPAAWAALGEEGR